MARILQGSLQTSPCPNALPFFPKMDPTCIVSMSHFVQAERFPLDGSHLGVSNVSWPMVVGSSCKRLSRKTSLAKS